jgi:excinuclease UvrABC ATPase subunit
MTDRILVRGAQPHNLKNVSLAIPKTALAWQIWVGTLRP